MVLLAVSIILSYVFDIQSIGVAIVGPVPNGVAPFGLPNVDKYAAARNCQDSFKVSIWQKVFQD